MLTFLYIMGAIIAATTYLCVCFKIGFIVSDKTQATGFYAGFYFITVFALICAPFVAVVAYHS